MQGKDNRRTPKREEIPIPKRSDFLRSLKKAAKAKPSTPPRRHPIFSSYSSSRSRSAATSPAMGTRTCAMLSR